MAKADGMDNHKRVVASTFSGSKEFWTNIYDTNTKAISKCYSIDMIRRKDAVFHLLSKYTSHPALRILDVGCGPGIFVGEAASRGYNIVGVDITEPMVSGARDATNKFGSQIIGYAQGDIENLPFRNNSFDVIFCIGVLSYLAEDAKSINELKRVVKIEGFVIVGLPNWLRLPILFDPYYYLHRVFTYVWKKKLFHDRNQESELIGLKEYRRYFAWKLNNLFKNFNLNILEIKTIGFGPMTFWRKEFIPYKQSLKFSQLLEKLSSKPLLYFLKIFANHWVICLQKIQN